MNEELAEILGIVFDLPRSARVLVFLDGTDQGGAFTAKEIANATGVSIAVPRYMESTRPDWIASDSDFGRPLVYSLRVPLDTIIDQAIEAEGKRTQDSRGRATTLRQIRRHRRKVQGVKG